MENMVNQEIWSDRRVAITGHTGFKGSWLSFWLFKLGAEVHGYALEPDSHPALFDQLNLSSKINHQIGDILDKEKLEDWFKSIQPQVVMHLAAQPLVLRSYKEPFLTWETNLIGTLNLLEAIRKLKSSCAIVVVTTDKVYENHEWTYAYREVDRLGGHDPYSSSKAAIELAVSSWRDSFFNSDSDIKVATARAGNVIGGGDWAEDRIVPDLVRSLSMSQTVCVRNPHAVRPWQHVLEPLSGYLQLAEKLVSDPNPMFQGAFNFGPEAKDFRSVKELIEESLIHWSGSWQDQSEYDALHEAHLLTLTIEKARKNIGWEPQWGFQEAIKHTITWYQKTLNKEELPEDLCRQQIQHFMGIKLYDR